MLFIVKLMSASCPEATVRCRPKADLRSVLWRKVRCDLEGRESAVRKFQAPRLRVAIATIFGKHSLSSVLYSLHKSFRITLGGEDFQTRLIRLFEVDALELSDVDGKHVAVSGEVPVSLEQQTPLVRFSIEAT